MDVDGTERPNADFALEAARAGARDLIAADIKTGKPVHLSHRIEVVGEDGSVCHLVLFGDEELTLDAFSLRKRARPDRAQCKMSASTSGPDVLSVELLAG